MLWDKHCGVRTAAGKALGNAKFVKGKQWREEPVPFHFAEKDGSFVIDKIWRGTIEEKWFEETFDGSPDLIDKYTKYYYIKVNNRKININNYFYQKLNEGYKVIIYYFYHEIGSFMHIYTIQR